MARSELHPSTTASRVAAGSGVVVAAAVVSLLCAVLAPSLAVVLPLVSLSAGGLSYLADVQRADQRRDG